MKALSSATNTLNSLGKLFFVKIHHTFFKWNGTDNNSDDDNGNDNQLNNNANVNKDDNIKIINNQEIINDDGKESFQQTNIINSMPILKKYMCLKLDYQMDWCMRCMKTQKLKNNKTCFYTL